MLRWYGTNQLKYLDQPITQGSVLELTSDLAESIERTVPNASLDTVLDQRNGEELIVNLRIGPDQAQIGV
jgi:phage baseplate assembly protein W